MRRLHSRRVSRSKILWVGSIGGMEADLVKRAGIAYTEIPAAGVHGVGLRRLPGNLARWPRGIARRAEVLAGFRPDVLFFTGGYVAVPMALAGRSIPSVVYVPDIEPGLALKTLAALCRPYCRQRRRVAPIFLIPALVWRSRVTRCAPICCAGTAAQAQQILGLSPELPTLLVFGGSKGARSINRALMAALPELLPEMQVVHITGTLDWPEVEHERSAWQSWRNRVERYHAFPYLHDEMGAAFAAADLAVCRAGASTLGELPAFGLPAILVPYPHAWRYQRVNADYLARAGAAVVLEDRICRMQLLPPVRELIRDSARLEAMRQACARWHAHRRRDGDAASRLLAELAGESPKRVKDVNR